MAVKIATQSYAYSIGGLKPSGYVANKCCTNAMAISCGCGDPGYAAERLVPISRIFKPYKVIYDLNYQNLDYYYVRVKFTDCNGIGQQFSYSSDGSDYEVLIETEWGGEESELTNPTNSEAVVMKYSYSNEESASITWEKTEYSDYTKFTANIGSTGGDGGSGDGGSGDGGSGDSGSGLIYTLTVESANYDMGYTMGSGEYYEGESVNIHAIPNVGYEFVEWELEDDYIDPFHAQSNPLNVTITGDCTYIAHFMMSEF